MIRCLLREGKEVEEKLTKAQLERAKEIAFHIKYGNDRKKEKSTESSESSEEQSKRAEAFDNQNERANSPSASSPLPDPRKIENAELDQELSSRNVSRPGTWRQLALLISCFTMMKNNVVFVDCFIQSGGLYFLIPYALMMLLVAMPMAMLELSISQYTSLPVFTLFERISPALSGLGYLVLVMRVFYTLFVSLEPRFLVFAMQSLATLLTNNAAWLRCKNYSTFRCYETTLTCAEEYVQVNDTCVPTLYAQDLANYSIIKHGTMEQLFACFITFCISGYFAYRGMRFFSKVAGIICLVPLFGMLPFGIMLSYHLNDKDDSIFQVITRSNNFNALFNSDTWVNACRATVKTMLGGDGTLLLLGSIADFRQNMFKDVMILSVVGTVVRMLIALALLPLFHMGFDVIYPFATNQYRPKELLQYWIIDLFFSALPSFNVAFISPRAFFAIIAAVYLSIAISYIGYLVITFEMIVSLFYYQFPRLLYLPEKMVRFCIIAGSTAFFMVLLTIFYSDARNSFGFNRFVGLEHYYLGLLAFFVFYEMLAVSFLYGSNRLLVNITTMLSTHKNWCNALNGSRWAIHVMWMIIIPFFSFLTIVTSSLTFTHTVFTFSSLIFCLITGLPLFCALRQLVASLMRGESTHVMLLTHRRWGPANIGNRRAAEHDERAARIVL